MSKINLDELFNNNFNCYTLSIVNWKEVDEPAITKDKFKELCLDFGKQLLELAAENAEIDRSKSLHVGSGYMHGLCVDKQSILDIIKQVE